MTLAESGNGLHFTRLRHDIVISIAMAVGLGALLFVLPHHWVMLATIGLAEIYTRRQRALLPSCVLALAFLVAACGTVYEVLTLWGVSNLNKPLEGQERGFVFAAGILYLAAVALYYWRYRLPLMRAALFSTGLVVLLEGLGLWLFEVASLFSISFMLFASAAILAVIATIAYRRQPSDRPGYTGIAFNLYLIAVPVLLVSLTSIIVLGARM